MTSLTARKRFTNNKRTKQAWEYVLSIPSNDVDNFGNSKRKQLTKSGFKTKKEALEEGRKLLELYQTRKLELRKNILFEDVEMSFFDYIEHEGDYARGTISNYKGLYKNHLQMFVKVPVTKLSHSLIKSWHRTIYNKGVSAHVYNDCIKLLKRSFNYAIEEKQVTVNPFAELKEKKIAKKLRKRFSTEQLKIIIRCCKKNLPDYYCLFILATLTGMRLGEYSALKPKDIDFENKLIYIEKQYTRKELKARTKTKESTRIIQVSEKVLEILNWHIQTFNIDANDFMFKLKTGNIVNAKWVERRFQKLLTINEFDKNFCRLHDLRGQFVDIMHLLGVSTEYISRAVGHSNVLTTSRAYTQILNELPVEANIKMDEKLFG